MTYWAKDGEEKKENNSGGSSSTSEVKHTNNRVYFYTYVDDKTILKFQEALETAAANVLTYAYNNRSKPAPVYIHINSGGGSLFGGFAAMDAIARCAAPTVSVVEGRAASAATLMSVAADKRLITPHSLMLIHQLSSGMWGTYENIKDHRDNVERYMDIIRKVYLERTKLSKKTLKELLQRDLYFPAEECVKMGLADGIYGGNDA